MDVGAHGCHEELGGEESKVVDEEVCRAEGDAVDAEKGADAEEGVEKGTVELVAGAEAEVLSADEGEEDGGRRIGLLTHDWDVSPDRPGPEPTIPVRRCIAVPTGRR